MAHNLTSTQLHKLRLAHTQYPKAPEFHPSYGTAGFRSLAERLPSTVYRYDRSRPSLHATMRTALKQSCTLDQLQLRIAFAALSRVTLGASKG